MAPRATYQNRSIATLFFLLVFFCAQAVLADSVNLPKTGQTKCYHQDGYELTDCADTGQDGDIQAGVAWPEPRFTDNGDGTLTDHLTGLMWLRDAECMAAPDGKINWQTALDRAAAFNQDPASLACYQYNHQALSYDDWRLPNINELDSLFHAGQVSQVEWLNSVGFYNVAGVWYWSSTSYNSSKSHAWVLGVPSGQIAHKPKTWSQTYRALIVRSAE